MFSLLVKRPHTPSMGRYVLEFTDVHIHTSRTPAQPCSWQLRYRHRAIQCAHARASTRTEILRSMGFSERSAKSYTFKSAAHCSCCISFPPSVDCKKRMSSTSQSSLSNVGGQTPLARR